MTTLTTTTEEPALGTVVDRMARREVAAHFLIPADQPPGVIRPPAPPMAVRIRTCPVCRADSGTFRASGIPLPFAEWRIVDADETGAGDLPTMTLLGCEWFAPRALLPVALAIERFGPVVASGFRSRAVALTELPGWPFGAALAEIDQQEDWLDVVLAGTADGFPARTACTVPAASRPVSPAVTWGAYRDSLTARFAGPHASDTDDGRWNARYLEIRRTTAAQTLRGYATCPA
ncbi:hypothetical protein KOI35_20460 [Actinoplanes bogorensis]|uniref:DUF2199 domain-containing protein n=1 Tax=Paractinoplanes bogorensis TaxID=1610840 RepID=A0ABS5YR19_9ACTN|nr:hypothetical protein [Actinoplanes bogorensis]MBU2665887.1 hypothetical protein [Actinoplanes bogorensis]